MSDREQNLPPPPFGGMPPVPATALPNYIPTYETAEMLNLIRIIRVKIDEFANNTLDEDISKLTQTEYLDQLAQRRKQIISEIRQIWTNLQIKWTEQTAGYKSSRKNLQKAANLIILRTNNIIGTADVTSQSKVNVTYRFLVHYLARMQSAIVMSTGDHLAKTEEMNYLLERIKVQGLSGMAARAGIQSQHPGFVSKVTRRFRRKKDPHKIK